MVLTVLNETSTGHLSHFLLSGMEIPVTAKDNLFRFVCFLIISSCLQNTVAPNVTKAEIKFTEGGARFEWMFQSIVILLLVYEENIIHNLE